MIKSADFLLIWSCFISLACDVGGDLICKPSINDKALIVEINGKKTFSGIFK